MKSYDVVVVGGGMAGLCAAAYCARSGYQTALIERRSKVGGLVDSFERDGFTFDGGIRAFANSGIVYPMLNDLGIDLPYVDNAVSMGFADEIVRLKSFESLDDYISMLKKLFPSEIIELNQIQREIMRVSRYMDVIYGIDNPLLRGEMDPKYLLGTLLPWFMKYQVNIRKAAKLNAPIREHLRRFTRNESLIDMISQHFFQETPAFFALSYFRLYLDYRYPLGGTGMLPLKMQQLLEDLAVDLRMKTEVVEVQVDKHQMILSNGETIRYRRLIWAADLRNLYQITTGVTGKTFEHQRNLTATSQGSDSILSFYVALDMEPDKLRDVPGHHMFYTPNLEGLNSLEPWDRTKDTENWLVRFFAQTTYEISCPVLRDPALAPSGQSGLVISCLFDYPLMKELETRGEYAWFKAFATRSMLETLDAHLIPGLKEAVLFTDCATPLTIERETGNTHGSITGWSFVNEESPAIDQFRKMTESIQTAIPDVYQAGQWTFSPAGLPVAILTGKIAADQAAKDLRKSK